MTKISKRTLYRRRIAFSHRVRAVGPWTWALMILDLWWGKTVWWLEAACGRGYSSHGRQEAEEAREQLSPSKENRQETHLARAYILKFPEPPKITVASWGKTIIQRAHRGILQVQILTVYTYTFLKTRVFSRKTNHFLKMTVKPLGLTELRLSHHSFGQHRPAEPMRHLQTQTCFMDFLCHVSRWWIKYIYVDMYRIFSTIFHWLELKSRGYSCLLGSW